MPKTGYVKLLAVYLASDLTLDTMTNGVKEIMDGITAMVDAEHDRLTKEIRECVNVTDYEDEDEFVKIREGLMGERDAIEDWMVRLARIGDTANTLPRDFLKALDISTLTLLRE